MAKYESRVPVMEVLIDRLERLLEHLHQPGMLDGARFTGSPSKTKIMGWSGGTNSALNLVSKEAFGSGAMATSKELGPEAQGRSVTVTPEMQRTMEPLRLLGKVRDLAPLEIPDDAGALELVVRDAQELLDRTWWFMERLTHGKTPGKGYVLPDDPKGFRVAALRLAARTFPWDTSCDAGRILNLLIGYAHEPPPGERLLGTWPAEVNPLDVARMWEGRMVLGTKMHLVSTVEKIGRIPSLGLFAGTGPEGAEKKSGFLVPAAFAEIWRAVESLSFWHRPHERLHPAHQALAAGVLSNNVPEQDLPKGEKAVMAFVDDLALEVMRKERELRDAIGYPELSGELEPGPKGDMLAADAELADLLESLGSVGAEHAERLRERARERWERRSEADGHPFDLWWNPEQEHLQPLALKLLAESLWLDVVKLRMERGRRMGTAAITRTVMNATIRISSRGLKMEGDETHGMVALAGPQEVGLVDMKQFARMCRIVPALDRGVVERKLKSLSTIPAVRFVWWAVWQGFENYKRADPDFRRVVVEGGFDGLRQHLKLKSRRQNETLRDVLDALQVVKLPIVGGGEVSLLMWDEIKAAPGRPAELRVTLNDPLLPMFTHEIPGKGRSRNEAARLIPIPRPELLPDGVGRRNDHAAQATLHLLTLREFSDQSDVLVKKGSIHIPPKRWKELADESELPSKLLDPVLDAWQQKAPGQVFIFPVVEEVSREHYILGPAYKQETKFLEEQGSIRIGSSKAGIRSVASRRRGKRGKGRKK